jgi:DNA-binding transcriptional LysR family regulator
LKREFGVHAVNRWRVADLELKHAMLLAGIGWGTMPTLRIAGDLAAGRLVQLKPTSWEGFDQLPNFTYVAAHRQDRPLGPAGRWLFERLGARAAS